MLPQAHGPSALRGRIRAEPEDFQVDEVLGFEPDGEGQHALVWVEKSGANTQWVATQLARAAGVAARDVGYSGLKDRRAVTRQGYTLPLAHADDPRRLLDVRGEGFRVLDARRHSRKLRRGSHRANRFRIVVRDIEGAVDGLPSRLAAIGRAGVPNYFGWQRFGREAANLARAREWSLGGTVPADRLQRGFALSAARSWLFNVVVAERVRRGDWNRLIDGEAVVLDGSASFFAAPVIDATLEARCAAFDVHPSAPLWGTGESPASGVARAAENSVLEAEPALCQLLEHEGLRHERRATRLAARNLEWQLMGTTLELGFELPRGAFATALLHEILTDAGEDSAATD
jgi:tRNA pseudouridine13 synthase